jgi:hypothetical protein
MVYVTADATAGTASRPTTTSPAAFVRNFSAALIVKVEDEILFVGFIVFMRFKNLFY